MMKKLLLLLCLFVVYGMSAQTETITIDWSFGSNSDVTPETASTNADRTIEVGDTVIWDFYSTGTHTVTSKPGSAETWDSGLISSGTGVTYSRTFNTIGVNDYECTPHPGNMYGTITVVAEGSLSVPDLQKNSNFDISPNPSRDRLNIKLQAYTDELKIEVFDVLGKRVYTGVLNQLNSTVNVSSWNSGIYLVRVSNEKAIETKRFIKQ
ncbi:MAG: T9SS type A sorting domain-containing protein [Winogradskyella sp.]|uniref:T9SS type A sorting domain-containing protein n=1 Tax=Winogradskyella sp. TaxID=1883156 RepID=UPI0017C11F6C|nr:T9SS type A sorting domain-containing protein [Winogradskyella sp.]